MAFVIQKVDTVHSQDAGRETVWPLAGHMTATIAANTG
jgi:hypothetical protein